MRMTTFALGSFGALAAMALGAAGCELIAAVDHDLIPDGGGAPGGGGGAGGASVTSTATSTTATTTTGMGGQGGGAGCDPMDCPDPGSDCLQRACNAMDMCEPTPLASGTACDTLMGQGGGTMGVCDGAGDCVECVDNTQCVTPPETVCDTTSNECVPVQCQNGVMDGDETGTDCGGPTCGACPNNQGCDDPTDCISGFCNALTCAACTLTSQCGGTEYCNAGVCDPKLGDGVMCTAGEQCSNGNCASAGAIQLCCDTPCGGGCQSCANAHTGLADGTCGNVTAGIDPKNFCNDTAANCDGANCQAGGICEFETSGDNCGSGPSCMTATLDPQDTCNASGVCQGGTPAACAGNFVCDTATSCFTMPCTAHAQCLTTHYCVDAALNTTGTTMGACEAKKGTGVACADDAECSLGPCIGAPAGLCT